MYINIKELPIVKLYLIPLFALCCILNLVGQELPPIEIYTPTQYGAENQNWGISQTSNKTIYVANNKGLLEFDGAKWRLYASPNETVIRSVKVINDLIYTGCYMEFGYWKKNSLGALEYTSLSKDLTSPLIEDEQFWKILAIDNWILFQSLNRIYVYDTKTSEFNVIESKVAVTKMYKVDNSIYYQDIGLGICKIENGIPKVVSGDSVMTKNIVVNVYLHNNMLLAETQDNGFYVIEKGTTKQWDIPAKDLLSKVSVYSSIQLQDGSFALGTISKGIIHLTKEGDVNYIINQQNGLSNNTVLSLFEDMEQNIWLGLDNGINCVNITSPFRIFRDENGTLGTVYASAIFKDLLYLGTNQGLFVKPLNSPEEFTFVEGTKGQVWCLVIYDNTLFCGHNIGTFIVDNYKASLKIPIDGTWDLKPVPNQKNLLFQGNYNGINVLEKINGDWTFRNKIEGFNNSTKFFEIFGTTELFVDHEYKGVYKITTNNAYTKALKVEKAPIEQGINSSLVKYNGQILYAYKKGVYSYDTEHKTFVKDSILNQIYDEESYTSGKLISEKLTNTLWGFSKEDISFLSERNFSGHPKLTKIAFPNTLRKGMTGYENISYLNQNKFLFGSSTGYTILDLDKISKKQYQISLNTVSNQTLDSDIFFADKTQTGDFKNNQNNLAFTFSIPEFDKYLKPEYQYQLEGFYNHWSSWSESSSELFKNLPYGSYTFKVRGKVGDVITNNVASYSFTIERPWYLSNLAWGIYALCLIFLSLLLHNVYKNYYKKQQRKLLKEAEHELELKELENEQQLMQFQNEKLQQDIENKNRELAISTMNLIKKNEFLNGIKNELKNSKEDKSIKSVIRIIDKNLNNKEDWKFFEEAFNNADKDFLNKIKDKHPTLTPNDLKLCAYLRLNLSSKEIAPLLNISAKSVEVKRYRLRKKMDLPHEASLTNYILEI
ncbi:triple tyrosine motif-containing protein [Mangrovimonas sp. YM274]|uniref:helix-turn-helix and ligand-binding sensor domain-containing protein n=1 Tax=Mangrovimonas sp. YM274 TaxID=3070660 RepID=UPI0027DE20E6|nr:triple tyrosine motif-containing protein [Mangrovimonas sp. YM274]WMI69154.1 triple tyrosine motif-containing protein [Mangrovimonas sp. YM274]